MTAIYRITQLGAPTRGGMNAAVDVSIAGIAKTNDESQFTIANEVIAAHIGQTLGLPVPAGVVAEDHRKRLYYISLDVSREGKKLPPIIPADFARSDPRLAAGVAVFDILIANGDRNGGNLSRDPGFNPPRVSMFDHGHALYGTSFPRGPDRVDLATDRLGCVIDASGIAVNTNVLFGQPLDARYLDEWVTRAKQIPAYVYEDICLDVATTPGLSVTGEMARSLASWLAMRAARVDRLIWDNQGSFPAVNWTLWPPGGQSP